MVVARSRALAVTEKLTHVIDFDPRWIRDQEDPQPDVSHNRQHTSQASRQAIALSVEMRPPGSGEKIDLVVTNVILEMPPPGSGGKIDPVVKNVVLEIRRES